MKRFSYKTLVLGITLSLSSVFVGTVYSNAAEPTDFRDVPKTHWAYKPIMLGVEKGYISGTGNGTFRPADSVTVAEFIAMMELSMTEKNSDGVVWWKDKVLNEVPAWVSGPLNNRTASFEKGSPWYQNYITTAKGLDLIRGEYDGRYTEALTRERVAKLVSGFDNLWHGAIPEAYANIAGPQLSKDYNRVDTYLRIAVAEAGLRGIMNGSTTGYFNPKATITRAEAAQICMVLADPSLRVRKDVKMVGVPFSNVPNPGFDPQTFVFANQEMKKVYDSMASAQRDFAGATDAFNGTLVYALDQDMRQKHFDSAHYMTMLDTNIYYDLIMGFNGNTYGLNLSTLDGSAERVSSVLDNFLALVDKTNASIVKKMITDAVTAARTNNAVNVSKVVGGRQIVINSNQYDFLRIAISAYSDKK